MRRKFFTAAVTITMTAVVVLAAMALMPASANAFSEFPGGGNCEACHTAGFKGPGDPLHDLHTPMIAGCSECHPAGGGGPATPVKMNWNNDGQRGCVGCHVGAGLRDHHRNVTPVASTCGATSCHPGDSPVGENILPPLYGTATVNGVDDPCNPTAAGMTNENWDADFMGLDNDGDNLYDGNDPDCQAAPPTAGATYNPGSGQFTAAVKVGGKEYDVTMAENSNFLAGDLANAGARVFTLSNFTKVTPSGTPDCTFTGATGELDCPIVNVTGLKTTYHVVFDKLAGGFIFQVRSAKKN